MGIRGQMFSCIDFLEEKTFNVRLGYRYTVLSVEKMEFLKGAC